MKTKLDPAVVAAAQCPPGKRRLDIYCSQVTGLMLEVRPSGGKTFHVRFVDQHGSTRQVKVGRADQISFDQARKAARKLIAEAALGQDPAAAKAERRAVPTYNELADQHLAYGRASLRDAGTLEGYLKRVRKRFGKVRLTDIKPQDVTAWLAELRAEGLAPASVLKALMTVNRSFVLGAAWHVAGTSRNPCKSVPRPKFANARQNYLDGEQTAKLLAAAAKSRNALMPELLSLLLLTGMRVSEALSTKWVDVDTERRALFVPTSKTSRSRTIPLSNAAIDVIGRIPKQKDSPYLFPSRSDPSRHLTTVKKAWQAIREEAGLTGTNLHDLRHSFATAAVAAGIDLYHVGRVLGHTSLSSTARYSHVANTTLLATVEAGAAKLNLNAAA